MPPGGIPVKKLTGLRSAVVCGALTVKSMLTVCSSLVSLTLLFFPTVRMHCVSVKIVKIISCCDKFREELAQYSKTTGFRLFRIA